MTTPGVGVTLNYKLDFTPVIEGLPALLLGCLGTLWLALAGMALAVVISLANTVLELFSPRGTDDFVMATANALICWAFGAMVLQ